MELGLVCVRANTGLIAVEWKGPRGTVWADCLMTVLWCVGLRMELPNLSILYVYISDTDHCIME